MRVLSALMLGELIADACAPRGGAPAPAPPAAAVRFQVLGDAGPSDTGPPSVRSAEQVVTIRGQSLQLEGGGLYGDVDLSEPRTVRLTLYDSLPGRPVTAPAPPSRRTPVVYQAQVGPLAPGTYEVWVGRYDPGRNLVEVPPEPLRIRVGRTAPRDSAEAAAHERR